MKSLLPACALAAFVFWPCFAVAQSAVTPQHKSTQVLVASADTPNQPYLAFPALLDLHGEILISFKRGKSHAGDTGAVLDFLRFNAVTGSIKSKGTLAQVDGQIMQMGEWVRFANGDIANYIDAQRKEAPTRTGLRVVRSTDGGHTFGKVGQVGVIDGVEYGYASEAVTVEKTTWMLAMTFVNLPGGANIKNHRPQTGSVDVIRSDDNGGTWRFVRSITEELGGEAVNESSLVPCGDGWLMAARGYGSKQWLLLTDGEFKVQRKVDLGEHAFIESPLGRPRVFTRDGGWYLLARNFRGLNADAEKGPMRLSLFKLDPAKLEITKHVVLDNAEAEKVADGYYAMPYWQQRDGKTYFNTVTYKRMADRKPDIISLEFDWDEVR